MGAHISDNVYPLTLNFISWTKITLARYLKSIILHEGIYHLGIHISMDGNHKVEEQALIQCHLFQKVFNWCPLTHTKAKVTYKTIFLPTVTYPFPTTFLSATSLEKPQSLTIMSAILSHLGYNCNMPKAVVYRWTSHKWTWFLPSSDRTSTAENTACVETLVCKVFTWHPHWFYPQSLSNARA